MDRIKRIIEKVEQLSVRVALENLRNLTNLSAEEFLQEAFELAKRLEALKLYNPCKQK